MKLAPLCLAASAFALIGAAAPAPAPSPVRLNQVGILENGPKRAIVADPSKTPLPWRLLDARGRVRGSGLTEVFGDDPWSGEHVHRIDFGSARSARYRLEVAGRTSRPFTISRTVYARLPYDALAYFYHNRAGTPIEARLVGREFARPAGHLPERATCVSGKDSKGNDWPGCSYTLDVTGGWYDAGDQGKYLVNGGITAWTLMNIFERQLHRRVRAPFGADGKAAIPEAGNRVSDLLDEVRWGMEFFLKMQVPDGTRAQVPVGVKRTVEGIKFNEIYASGMAHHKVADVRWTPLPTAPHEDKEKRQLFPPTTGATLNLAATAAQCARIWRGIDAAFSARCLAAGEKAYAAALRNPEVYALADFTGSGPYGDGDLSDEFYWAAAELFATTGKAYYAKAVRSSPHFGASTPPEISWGSVATLGTISLAVVPSKLPQTEVTRLRGAVQAAADLYLADTAKVGYAIPYAPARGYPWGSTSSVLNRAIVLALASDFSRQRRYRDRVIDAMDYILGRNPLDVSFVSGYGARPMQNPHHRFWARQASAKYPPPPPGAISGGPNSNPSDDVTRHMRGKCVHQTCWLDDYRSYSLNEVAINWNAPLVWVGAYLQE